MRKIIIILLSTFLLSSCENKDDLEIVVLNKEVNCLNSQYKFKNQTDWIKYDSISLNRINFKIKNNSNNKYLIYFDGNGFETNERYKDVEGNYLNNPKNGIIFNLYKNDSLNTGRYFPNIINFDESNANDYYKNPKNRSWILKYYDVEINKRKGLVIDKDEIVSMTKSEIIRYSFVLYPNQSKYFTIPINLPLRSSSEGVNWISDIDNKNNYKAGISLKCNSNEIVKFLTNDLKKEIEENELKVFDGTIQSNKIPVKMISMSKN